MIPPLSRELLKHAVKSAATAGAAAVLRRLADAVPGTPGLVLKGAIAAASIAAGFFNRP